MQQFQSRDNYSHGSSEDYRELCTLFAPNITETLAVHLERAPTRPTTVQVHPAGALTITLPAVISQNSILAHGLGGPLNPG